MQAPQLDKGCSKTEIRSRSGEIIQKGSNDAAIFFAKAMPYKRFKLTHLIHRV